ncbi:hypothetical protein A4X03_0g6596, partial [Tilletia caries]
RPQSDEDSAAAANMYPCLRSAGSTSKVSLLEGLTLAPCPSMSDDSMADLNLNSSAAAELTCF